ncbi:MAG: helix-turn-helix domain-containing protein [Erysipelotrichaceae bacterium]
MERDKKSMSIEELSRKSGLSAGAIHKYEKGNNNISTKSLKKVC